MNARKHVDKFRNRMVPKKAHVEAAKSKASKVLHLENSTVEDDSSDYSSYEDLPPPPPRVSNIERDIRSILSGSRR